VPCHDHGLNAVRRPGTARGGLDRRLGETEPGGDLGALRDQDGDVSLPSVGPSQDRGRENGSPARTPPAAAPRSACPRCVAAYANKPAGPGPARSPKAIPTRSPPYQPDRSSWPGNHPAMARGEPAPPADPRRRIWAAIKPHIANTAPGTIADRARKAHAFFQHRDNAQTALFVSSPAPDVAELPLTQGDDCERRDAPCPRQRHVSIRQWAHGNRSWRPPGRGARQIRCSLSTDNEHSRRDRPVLVEHTIGRMGTSVMPEPGADQIAGRDRSADPDRREEH
jgi:hypothetical protein